MIAFFGTVIAMLIMLLVMGLVVKAGDDFMDGERRRGCLWAGAAICLVSAIVAIGVSQASDPHANVLCSRGHEVWERQYTPPMVVGKVIVQGTPYTAKRWQCDQWESR